MSTGYKIEDQSASYFLTFQIVQWADIFTRKIYRDIIIDSFKYCRDHKGLEIYDYVIMSNHILQEKKIIAFDILAYYQVVRHQLLIYQSSTNYKRILMVY